MMTNQEQRDNELLYLLSEGLSEYLQGYTYEQGGPAFDTLETASLNLTPELGRQGFKNGGITGIGAVPEAAISLGLNVALDATPISVALGLANLGVAALTGKTISEQIGLTPDLFSSPTGFFGGLPIEIENPATGQITTLSGRQAIQDSQRGTPDLSFSPQLTSQLSQPSITGPELSEEGPPDTAPPGRSATPQIDIEELHVHSKKRTSIKCSRIDLEDK